jgi:hypothetical protein
MQAWPPSVRKLRSHLSFKIFTGYFSLRCINGGSLNHGKQRVRGDLLLQQAAHPLEIFSPVYFGSINFICTFQLFVELVNRWALLMQGTHNCSYAIAGSVGSLGFSTIPYWSSRPKTNHLRLPLLHIAATVWRSLKQTRNNTDKHNKTTN